MKIPECITRRPTTDEVEAAEAKVRAAGMVVWDMVHGMGRADRGEVYVLVAAIFDATERAEEAGARVAALEDEERKALEEELRDRRLQILRAQREGYCTDVECYGDDFGDAARALADYLIVEEARG